MKHNRKLKSLLFLSAILSPLALSSPALARVTTQEPEPPQAEKPQELPSARSVIDRFLEVTKAREVADKKSSMHMKGTLSLIGMEISGELEVFASKTSNMFTKINLGPAIGVVEQGCIGDVTWNVDPMMGTGLLEGAEHHQRVREADWRAAFKEASKFDSIKTLGREVFAKTDCYVLEFVSKPAKDQDALKSKALRTSLEYYAVESSLLLGTSSVAATPVGESKTVVQVSDYVEYGGSLIPTKMSVVAAGAKYEIVIESVEFDKVDPAVFVVPPTIQKLVDARAAKQAEAEAKAKAKEAGDSGGK